MSRLITSVCLILAIIAYSVCAAFVIKDENSELNEIIDSIRTQNENDDTVGAAKSADRLNEKWERFERKMSVLVKDDKLNNISTSVSRVKPYIEEANDELDAELRNITRQLDLLYRMELPLWYNIL